MSRVNIEIDDLPDGSARGVVFFHMDAEPLKPEEQAFLDACYEAARDGTTMSIEQNGKRYAGVRIVAVRQSA